MSTNPIVKNKEFNERQIKRIFYRRLGTVIWVSFLMAALQCGVFFALFNPQELALLSSLNLDVSIMQGYALGFVFFWVFTFLASFLCGILMALPRAKLAKRTTESL